MPDSCVSLVECDSKLGYHVQGEDWIQVKNRKKKDSTFAVKANLNKACGMNGDGSSKYDHD